MVDFLIGFYIAIAICTFIATMFLVVLGGRNKDLWKPFIVAAFWPIFIPLILLRKI